MLKDASHPFFRPLWRRIAVVVVCLAWSGVEWIFGEPFWGTLTLAIGAYALWAFFITFDPAPPDDPAGKP